MNEQIQQMIFSLNDKVGVHWTHEDKIKFAELIVRECCQKLENDGMVEVAMEMKQHFGIL